MISGFGTLITFLLIGEIVSRGLHLVVPGTIIGLVGLFLILLWRSARGGPSAGSVDDTTVGQVSNGLLQNLSIMFVPAGVGVVQYLEVLTEIGPRVVAILIASTVMTLAATALTFTTVSRLQRWSTQDRRAGLPKASEEKS